MATSPQTPLPIIGTQLKLSDLQTEGLPMLNTIITQMQTQINTLTGANGKTKLPAGVDVAGATVSGVGEPQSSSDAVSKSHAERNYSAAALAPQLESGAKGGAGLKTFRALNSRAQQETNSTYLNTMMNTAPTCNSSTISAAAPSGGSIAVTITAGYHYYVDGMKITPYAQRTDTLALPSSITITSATRTGNVVTLHLSSSPGISVGQPFAVAGVTDATFDGSFIAAAGTSGSTLVYNQVGINATSSGGMVSIASCYYYYIQQNSQTLALSPSFPSDTQQNRLSINIDQSVLIAVIVLNSGGIDLTQSAAGATPPQVTGNSRLLTRL